MLAGGQLERKLCMKERVLCLMHVSETTKTLMYVPGQKGMLCNYSGITLLLILLPAVDTLF